MPGDFRYVVSTNITTVTAGTSGSPADCASFVAADRVGGYTATITGATKANPCVITATAHGFTNGDYVRITGVSGMVELNNRVFVVANKATNTFQLLGIDSTGYTTYTSGGTAQNRTYLKAYFSPSKTFTLAYPVRPVELRALVVNFIIASKTAEADYLFITGTDAWDAAQTESIDVSAGNGTYTSTKRWRTISNISCSDAADGTGTLWADGTLAVTQDIWGVIWDKGLGQYQIDCKFYKGDGTTATHFVSKNEDLAFKDGILTGTGQTFFDTKANAVADFGAVVDAENKVTKNGSSIRIFETTYWNYMFSAGTVNLYGCKISHDGTNDGRTYVGCTSSPIASTALVNVWNTTFNGTLFLGVRDQTNAYNNSFLNTFPDYVSSTYARDCFRVMGSGTFANLFNIGGHCGPLFQWGATVSNLTNYVRQWGFGMDAIGPGMNCYLIDWTSNLWTVFYGGTTGGSGWRQYTCNIHVADKDGVNLSGATVLCEDKDNTQVFSVETDANGNIAQQVISYIRYWKDGTAQSYTYSPHKFTISKAGYQTLVLENITVSSAIKWHKELQQPSGGGASFRQIGIGVQN